MTSCFENMQMPSCVWFEGGEKRNALISMLAGTLVYLQIYLSHNINMYKNDFIFVAELILGFE